MISFGHLRAIPWDPSFEWVATAREAANQINSFHEDYPKYVDITKSTLLGVASLRIPYIRNSTLLNVHGRIFSDQPLAGKWREVNVRVGSHFPPEKSRIANLMKNLEDAYLISDCKDLADWYTDFETIHPFQDGNGRVGGVIVAAYSHCMHPERGWYTPKQ